MVGLVFGRVAIVLRISAATDCWPMDWGRIAIVKPDQISIPSAIIFSALVFTYNGFAAYLFFAGHIFMHLMKSDFVLIMKSIEFDNLRVVGGTQLLLTLSGDHQVDRQLALHLDN